MELSVLIPARNEEFLRNTVEDIAAHKEAETEVIAVFDGEWIDPPIPQLPDVNILYVPKSIGQRAATNMACRLSRAKYVMKCDAHCSFDQGFDRKMIEAFQRAGDNVTMVPVMKNLHVFNWRCHRCGWWKYQGPKPDRCGSCKDSRFIRRKMVWKPKRRTYNYSYCFDAEPHFGYFKEYNRRPEFEEALEKTGLTETMSLQGSCFMLTREKYWELNICGEELGNWGNQGIEVACKTWLSGGKVLANHATWYAHMFRTQTGFSFPWGMSGRETQKTKENVKNLLWNNKFDKQIYPVSWLVEKFWPIPANDKHRGWTDADLERLKQHERELKSQLQTK